MADYMVRIIRSGKVEEKVCFPINPGTKVRRPKSRGSLPRQQDHNERDSIKRVTRIINCNFEQGDLLLTLNYDDAGYSKLGVADENTLREHADKEAVKFLDRLRYHMKKHGIEPRYMLFTSDVDGDTGELVRPHHHLLIKSEGFEFDGGIISVLGKDLRKIWKNGGINMQTLHEQDSYNQLAAYLYRQVRRLALGENKYHGSANLKKPELIMERIVHSNRRLRLPKGAKLLKREDPMYSPDGVQYLCYVRPEKNKKNRRKGNGGEG